MTTSNTQLEALKKLVLEHFAGENIKIFLFGSRANGTNSNHSDVDVGLLSYKSLPIASISLLREKIENMNIVYKVDIVDFSCVSAVFFDNAIKEAVVWKELV